MQHRRVHEMKEPKEWKEEIFFLVVDTKYIHAVKARGGGNCARELLLLLAARRKSVTTRQRETRDTLCRRIFSLSLVSFLSSSSSTLLANRNPPSVRVHCATRAHVSSSFKVEIARHFLLFCCRLKITNETKQSLSIIVPPVLRSLFVQ